MYECRRAQKTYIHYCQNAAKMQTYSGLTSRVVRNQTNVCFQVFRRTRISRGKNVDKHTFQEQMDLRDLCAITRVALSKGVIAKYTQLIRTYLYVDMCTNTNTHTHPHTETTHLHPDPSDLYWARKELTRMRGSCHKSQPPWAHAAAVAALPVYTHTHTHVQHTRLVSEFLTLESGAKVRNVHAHSTTRPQKHPLSHTHHCASTRRLVCNIWIMMCKIW